MESGKVEEHQMLRTDLRNKLASVLPVIKGVKTIEPVGNYKIRVTLDSDIIIDVNIDPNHKER